jgi:vancomycin resistance protein YoaR
VSEQTSTPAISRRTLFYVGVGIAAIIAVFLGIFVATNDAVRPGTTVSGVAIGGMSADEAIGVLEESVGAKINRKLEISVGDQVFEVRPRAAGITLDARATVEQASATGFNPLSVIFDLFGSRDIEPIIAVDQDALVDSVASIADVVNFNPIEPQLAVTKNRITLTPGSDGLEVDREALENQIVSAVTQTRSTIVAPLEITPPRVSATDAANAQALAKQAVASPVTVSVGEITATIAPETIAQALSFTTQGNQLSPELDGAVLHASIANALKRAETPGRNASFKIADGSPFVVPSVVGSGVSDGELATAVLGVLSAEGIDRSASVPLGTRDPELTTAEAQQLGINDKLSSFTQNFVYAAYRVTNIGQAAKYVNDTILMPGETFSMNDTIKERTVKNGYTVGTIIGPGGVFEDALGGGVSAATTAVWTAAFFAGMERTDTRAHSLYISRYQPGLEATVAWGVFDMRFTNDSPNAVLIKTKMTNSSMKVTFWGTRLYDSIEAEFGERVNIKQPKKIVMTNKQCSPQTGIEGFTITVDRVFIKDGEEVIREPMTTIYNAGPNVVCKKKKPKLDVLDPAGAEFDNSSPSPSASESSSASAKPDKPKKPAN